MTRLQHAINTARQIVAAGDAIRYMVDDGMVYLLTDAGWNPDPLNWEPETGWHAGESQ